MSQVRPLIIDLEGQKVHAYRCLAKGPTFGLISLKVNGLVVAHVETCNLLNVVFKVVKGGHQRAVAEDCRNVHAYAVGTYTSQATAGAEAVTYNYQQGPHFYRRADKKPVYEAKAARITGANAFI